MGISAKLTVAGAAGLFGLVIAAGGAVAASGSTLVADAPGTALQVQGIGAAPATQLGANARLKLLAAAELDGTIETVFPATAVALGGATTDSPAAGAEQAATDPRSNETSTPPDAPIAVGDSGGDSTPGSTQDAGTGNSGNPGNGNTNNGKGNDGVSGNGNTDNGNGNSGDNGNSGTPGNGNTNNGQGNDGVSGNGNTNNGNGNPGNNGKGNNK